jgi:hypothetical protein
MAALLVEILFCVWNAVLDDTAKRLMLRIVRLSSAAVKNTDLQPCRGPQRRVTENAAVRSLASHTAKMM